MNHKRSPAADSGQESFVFQEIKRFQHRLARHAETLRKLILGRQATAHRKDALLQFPDKGIVNVFVFCGCVHSSSLRYYRLLLYYRKTTFAREYVNVFPINVHIFETTAGIWPARLWSHPD